MVFIDRIEIEQVLVNLVQNAVEAMAHNSMERRLKIRAGLDSDNMVRVRVCDCGPGIPSNLIQKVLHPYYTTKENGVGLGLSISRSIIDMHDGRLWIENLNSSGASLNFTIPVAQKPSGELCNTTQQSLS